MSILVFILTGCTQQTSPVPQLTKNIHGTTQLMVDGRPFLMIAGELHNSSASTIEYMTLLFRQLKEMNPNTVLAVIAWEQFEPQEGIFYTLVDAMLDNARKDELKQVLLWFGSWKNGESSYMPIWVKQDTQRFFRVKNEEGKNIEVVSPFCIEAMQADSKAFSTLMQRLAKVDKERTVIIVQPENEVGLFQETDFNEIALTQFQQNVSTELTGYLERNTDLLKENIRQQWKDNGSKTQGTWKEVFGDSIQTKEIFMAWQYATYINEIAKAEKAAYPLPMFVNAWLVQYPGQTPGKYPNGGRVVHVMDIYKARAEHIDAVCPDIYLPNFKEICAEYTRTDNPLIIPESRMEAGRAFYAFAEHHAICFAPFAIEDGDGNIQLIQSYGMLKELEELIPKYQRSGKIRGVLKAKDKTEQEISFGDYIFRIKYEKNKEETFGLII